MDHTYVDSSKAASGCARCSAGPSCRRHDPGRIRRPCNPFIVYLMEFVQINRQPKGQRKRKVPGSFRNEAQLSKLAGRTWRAMSTEEKRPYITEANRLRKEHRKMYPDYKYRPNCGKNGATKKSKTHLANTTPEPLNSYVPSSIPAAPWAAEEGGCSPGIRFGSVLADQPVGLGSPAPNQPSPLGWSLSTETAPPLPPLTTSLNDGFTSNYHYAPEMDYPNSQAYHQQYSYHYNMEAPLHPQFYPSYYLIDDGTCIF